MSGQPGLGGGDWRATVTEQVRSQHLISLVGNLLHGLPEPQQEVVHGLIAQNELRAFSMASTAQEYLTMLANVVAELRQRLGAHAGNQAAKAAAGAVPQSGAVASVAAPMPQGAPFSQQQAHTPALSQAQLQAQLQAHAQAQAQAAPPAGPAPTAAAGQGGMQQDLLKLRDIIQHPENHSLEDITKALHMLRNQLGAGTNNNPGLVEIFRRLAIEAKKRQQIAQVQVALRQQQQQQHQQQQHVAGIPGAQAAAAIPGTGGFSQAPQLTQQQLLQLRLHSQQMQMQSQGQLQALQGQPQLAAAFANVAQQQPQLAVAAAPAGTGGASAEELQQWHAELLTFSHDFSISGYTVPLTVAQAYKSIMQSRQRGEAHIEAMLNQALVELVRLAGEKHKKAVPVEAIQMVLHETVAAIGISLTAEQIYAQAAAVAANAARATPNASAAVPASLMSPAPAMATLGAHPAAPPSNVAPHGSLAAGLAAPQALKRQGSGKNSPSVASAKPKKKSQSPRTSSKTRKGSPEKAGSAAVAPATQGAPAAATAAVPVQMGPVSAEAATKVVDDIIGSISSDAMRARPRLELSDAEKKQVRESLPGLEGLLAGNRQVMRAVYMRTQSRELVAQAYSAEIAVMEQRRLLDVDQYIIRPETVHHIFGILQKTISLAKEWGLAQQSLGAPAGTLAPPDARLSVARGEAADQATPLTNMHPDALTRDPALENFQKAVKHPLDPGNLRLPTTKKRATGKGGLPGSGGQTPTTAAAMLSSPPGSHQLQPAPAAFVPAPMMLPPNMTRDEFDRLPLDMRTGILKSQQSALIRQQSIGIESSSAAATGGAHANPLLMAAEQGMSSGGDLLSKDEQRLRALEQDKWNNPLEYLMCVLDRFTASAERAGVEPAPILQQAFWPIARRSGAIAADAVL